MPRALPRPLTLDPPAGPCPAPADAVPELNDVGTTGAPPVRTALVIDDEVMVLQGLSIALSHLGWCVIAATSAEEAVQRLDGIAAPPVVIVADYRLRAGQTGVDAIRAVCAHLGCSIPAFLLTGDTSPDRLREARASGYTVLYKPVTLRELAALLPADRALQPA